MVSSPVARTTHTIEMAQIDDLNQRLSATPRPPAITADQLGLSGAHLMSRGEGGLAGTAVLVRLCWDGPPEWPYIHAHFSAPGSTDDSLVVDLHTAALLELSHRLHVHQVWGV